MANQSNYHNNGIYPGYYPSLPPISRDMGPPMDFPLKPMEVDLNHPRTLLPPGLGDFAFPSSSTAKMAPMDGYSRYPPDPIAQWYNNNDGPWVHHKAIPEIGGERLLSKHLYRQTNPSEAGSSFPCNNPHSDSGYGTRRSVANTSVFSVDQDCQSLSSHLTDYPPQYQAISELIQQRDVRVNEAWGDAPDVSNLICPTCKKAVKTQSELKKHDLRHTKPFVCKVNGCPRTAGFSTTNDLERHIKSKHPSVISNNKYRCCVPDCKSRDKSWPRLDNFRSHLKRIHPQLNSEQYESMIRRAEFFETPLDLEQELPPQMSDFYSEPAKANNLSRYNGSTLGNLASTNWKPIHREINRPIQDLILPSRLEIPGTMATSAGTRSPPPEAPQSEIETVQPVDIFQPPSVMLNATVISPLAQVSEEGTRNSTNFQNKATRQTLDSDATLTEVIKSALERTESGSLSHDLPTGKASPKDSGASPQLSSSSSDEKDSPSSEIIESQRRSTALAVIRVLRERGFHLQKIEPVAEPEITQNAGSTASKKSDNQVICQVCKKFKGRPCELKKHMKRHERPYGCTFAACNKTFGSKNDWKRHENSQHFHLETWRCDERRPESEGSTPCGKVCYRKQTFQEHLIKAHQITNEVMQKQKLDSFRIGMNCQGQFWCGFCEKTIQLEKKGLDAWGERFDHIDDHFMGRRGLQAQSILDWTQIDAQPTQESVDVIISDLRETSSLSTLASVALGGASLKRIRSPEEVEERAKKNKHTKNSAPLDILVYCCQCHISHNPKLDQSCSQCPDSHRFCDNCEVRHECRATET